MAEENKNINFPEVENKNLVNQSKVALQLAIEAGEKIDKKRYTEESYSKLYNSVKEGKLVLNSDSFKDEEINVATNKIKKSIKNLRLNDKAIESGAGVLSAEQLENERKQLEIEKVREEFDNSSSNIDAENLSEEDIEKNKANEAEQLRIEKREKELKDTLNKKEELDKKRMKSDSEVVGEREIGRDSDKKRFKERVVDERTDIEELEKLKNKDDEDVSEEVKEEKKKVEEKDFKDKHDAFSREERVYNKNQNIPNADEDEILTPAAQMAKEMQEAAEREDMGLEPESKSQIAGIEEKKKDKKISEYDKKIKEKYSSLKHENKNYEEPIDEEQRSNVIRGTEESSQEDINKTYKESFKRQHADKNEGVSSREVSSREERILDNNAFIDKKEDTLTPAAQIAKDMSSNSSLKEQVSDVTNKANDATFGGAKIAQSSAMDGAGNSEKDDEKKKQSHAKKMAKSGFEYLENHEEIKEIYQEKISGKNISTSTSSITEAAGIENKAKEEVKKDSDKEFNLKKSENKEVQEADGRRPLGREAHYKDKKKQETFNKELNKKDVSKKNIDKKTNEKINVKENKKETLHTKEKKQADLEKEFIKTKEDKLKESQSSSNKKETSEQVFKKNKPNKLNREKIKPDELINNSSFQTNNTPKTSTTDVFKTAGISEAKESQIKVENSADKMLRENEEKLGKEKDLKTKINEKDEIKKKADKELLKSKKDRVEIKGKIRNIDGVDVVESNDKNIIHKKGLKKGEKVSSDELVKNGPLNNAVDVKNPNYKSALGIDFKSESVRVKNSAEKMLEKNYDLLKQQKLEGTKAYRKEEKELKTVEQKRQEEIAKQKQPKGSINSDNYVKNNNRMSPLNGKDSIKGKAGDLNSVIGSKGFSGKGKDPKFDETTGKLKNKNAGIAYKKDDNIKVVNKENLKDSAVKGPQINNKNDKFNVLDKNKEMESKIAKGTKNEGYIYGNPNLNLSPKDLKRIKSTDKNINSITTEGYDSLTNSSGIKADAKDESKNIKRSSNKGSVKMSRGDVLNTEEKIHKKEDGGMRIGKNAGIQDKNSVAAGIRRKEDQLNKHIKSEEEKKLEKLKRIKDKSATEQYNEISKNSKGAIKLSRSGEQTTRTFGKTMEDGPTAKINTRFSKLNSKSKERLSKRDAKINTDPLRGKAPRSGIKAASEKARLANLNRLRFLQKQGMSGMGGFNTMGTQGGIAKVQTVIQNFAKKALSATVLSGIAIGGIAGSGGFKKGQDDKSTNNKWYPTQANISEKGILAPSIPIGDTEQKTLTQVAMELVQYRLKAYYKQVMNEDLSAEEAEKAGINIKPLERLKIKKFTLEGQEMDPNSITFETVDEFKIDYEYEGSFSTHVEPIGVGIKEAKFDFVDRYAQTIGKDWFILDEFSDIRFPDGSQGDGANLSQSNDLMLPPDAGSAPSPGATETTHPSGKTNELGETQMDIMLNICGAVETGGQIYGQKNYANIIGRDFASEKTMTIGWSSFYGANAKNYLQRFKQENPELFRDFDPTGEVNESLSIGSWEKSMFVGNGAWKEAVRKMLTSEPGMKLQDTMTSSRLVKNWQRCSSKFTNNMQAVAMYTEIAELGGSGAADAVFKNCNGNYSLDNIMKVLKEKHSYKESAVGAARYDTRHRLIKEWIEEKIQPMDIVDIGNVEVTGAGAVDLGGFTPSSPAQDKGLVLFIREMLSMSMTGGFYKDPANKKDYLTYIIDVIDYAVSMDGDEKLGGQRGVDLAMTIVPSGQTVTWTTIDDEEDSAAGMMLKAEFRIPVMSDLKVLEENDKNFKDSWDYKGIDGKSELAQRYGDFTVQSYIALHSSDFNRLFNINVQPINFGGLDYGFGIEGGFDGTFNGVTGIPYIDWGIMIANDDRHGYSQPNRASGVDFDCSSFVWYALKQAGFTMPSNYPFTTASMDGQLRAMGFQRFAFNKSLLQPGDIVLRRTKDGGHTEIYIGNGQTVGAHSSRETVGDYDYGIHGTPGDQDGREISVVPCDIYQWVYRPPKSYVDQINEQIGGNQEKPERP